MQVADAVCFDSNNVRLKVGDEIIFSENSKKYKGVVLRLINNNIIKVDCFKDGAFELNSTILSRVR